MDIEQLATSTIKMLIARMSLLSAYIAEKDKEPLWDGHIYIYTNKSKKNESLYGRIPVQVKGERVKSINKPTLTFHVPISDLRSYRTLGVLYLVVGIDDNSDTKSYYSLLQPIKIKKLLANKGGQQGTNIKLEELPTDEHELVAVLMNFFDDCKKQVSFVDTPTLKLEDFKTHETSINVTCFGNSPDSLFDYIFNHEVCLYAKPPLDIYPDIPLDTVNCLQLERTIEKSITIKGKTHYSLYHLVYTKSGKYLQIGKSIRFNIGENLKADFNLQGTLSEQITDMSFLLDFFQAGEVTLGDATIHQDPTKIDEEITPRIAEFQEHLKYLKDIRNVLTALNVKEELVIDYNDFKPEYREKITLLIDVILRKKRCFNKGLNDASPCLCGLQIFNLYIPVVFVKGKGKQSDMFINIFEQEVNVSISRSNGETYPISKYVLLEQINYKELPPQYYDRIISSFKQNIMDCPILADRLNYSLLDMLRAYDKTANPKLLDLCINFSKWLLENANELPLPIRQLNYLQSVKRLRLLTGSELSIINDIIQNDTDPEHKIAAYLLCDNQVQAQVLFNTLDDQKRFRTFPIYQLLNA